MRKITRTPSATTFIAQPLVFVALAPEQLLTAVGGPLPVIAF